MARAYIAVGSNIQPEENVRKAVKLLSQRVKLTAISTVYETAPEGLPAGRQTGGRNQPPYYNCVLAIETDLPPVELKRSVLRRIEDELGRQRGQDRFASRTIDLDLILYDNLTLSVGAQHAVLLHLPDPEIRERPYLALPLFELDPGLTLPDTGESIGQIAGRLGSVGLTPLPDYTLALQTEIADGHG
jgi:dihydroneopterin aldolase/2-amino-4-hydroxy-6-hydroxymethyldihydropteridine diphosphokinase